MGTLRTLFAITIILQHSPWNDGYVFIGGRNAVQLFYMISGFLISYILNNSPAYNRASNFYISRILRIYPLYYVVAFLSFLTFIVARNHAFAIIQAAPFAGQVMLVISNILIFGQDWMMFTAVNGGHFHFSATPQDTELYLRDGLLVPPAWTLGVELTFYAIAPFVLRNRKLLFALLATSILLRVGFILLGPGLWNKDSWDYRFFPFELAFFLLGAVAQQVFLPLWQSFSGRVKFAHYGTVGFAFFTIIYFLIPMAEIQKTLLLFGAFFFVLPLAFIFQNEHKLDALIGELSYPIYISHWLVLIWIRELFDSFHAGEGPLNSAINVVLSVGFAVLLNALVASPLEKFRRRVKRRYERAESPRSNFAVAGSGTAAE